MATETKVDLSNLTEEDAKIIANEIVRLDAVVKDMKKKLKGYVEENGALETQHVKWDFNDSISYKWNDSEKLKEFLKNTVIDGLVADPYSLVTINKTELNKLEIDESYISSFAEKKVTKTFKSTKL
ncbi:hypothetical protein H0266_18350 [Halobacillus locisalis]|uniref:Uncharacterized protein n=1 Tax=Halobacillus locisalis TaxID=220753 RepID=A0A838CY42_9BACI|nr:hypothetical protein [Halobacillus locisalis]MBA2176844.1 hypothetical protein [Halobacillus locisalis]